MVGGLAMDGTNKTSAASLCDAGEIAAHALAPLRFAKAWHPEWSAQRPPQDAQRPLQDTDEVVRQLRDKLDRYRHNRARQAGWTRRFIPTGLEPLDAALPHGGLPCGAITEIYADHPGVGAMTLAMRIVGRSGERKGSGASDKATKRESDAGEGSSNPSPSVRTADPTWRHAFAAQKHGTRPFVPSSLPVVLIDTHGDFYPPAAEALGIPLDRLIILRVPRPKDVLWAAQQSLRCPAVGTVIAPLTDVDERESRRLQLAAESSGCLGLLLRPAHRRFKSFAAVQMLVERDERTEGRRDEGSEPRPSGSGPKEGSRATYEATERRSDGGWHGKTCMPAQTTEKDGGWSDHVGSAVRTDGKRLRDEETKEHRRSTVDWGRVHGGLLNEENQHASLRNGYHCRITLLAVREGMPTSPCRVDLYHETGTGDLHSLPVDRSMAKTG